jgi:hypothetical protein
MIPAARIAAATELRRCADGLASDVPAILTRERHQQGGA